MNKNDLIILEKNEMNILNEIISNISLKVNNNKKPLIILGPSGVGKDTIINILLKKYPETFYKLPSYTTREIRENMEKIIILYPKKNFKY